MASRDSSPSTTSRSSSRCHTSAAAAPLEKRRSQERVERRSAGYLVSVSSSYESTFWFHVQTALAGEASDHSPPAGQTASLKEQLITRLLAVFYYFNQGNKPGRPCFQTKGWELTRVGRWTAQDSGGGGCFIVKGQR